jgi:hypothetical protein
MINHPECYWCKAETTLCDNCVNEMHILNGHTPTQSRCIGRVCFHDDKETKKVGCEWNAWFYPEDKCDTKKPFVMKCEGKCK